MACGSLEISTSSGTLDLHAVGHFVGGDARGDFRIAIRRLQIHLIETLDHVERIARRCSSVHSFGVGQEQHRVALRAELDALIDRGQKSAAPAGFAAVGLVFPGEQHHETRQIRALAAQPVSQPRAHAGTADDLEAGVHEDLGRRVVELRGVHRPHDRDVVGDFAEGAAAARKFQRPIAALLEIRTASPAASARP